MKKIIINILFILFSINSYSQREITQRELHEATVASFETLKELLAIPNDANFPEDIEKNITWVESNMAALGFTTQRLDTETVPLVLANYKTEKPDQKTIMYYFHIDGQPVDPQFWFQDDPYQAVLKEQIEGEGWVDIHWNKLTTEDINPDWRIYARSASDDKSPFVMFLTVMKLIEEKLQMAFTNIKKCNMFCVNFQ